MSRFERQFGVELEICGITKEQAMQAATEAGIRIQIERYNHVDHSNFWKIVPDASVQNGFEIVSPILKGEEGLREVTKLADAIDAAGATANKSCGLHIHFDARNLTADEIKTTCKRYAKFEEKIDAFMPESRRGNSNRFCNSVIECFGSERFLNAASIEDMARSQQFRYFKVNLQAYLRHNTIEFRQHNGTVKANKITNWILFLSEFMTESIRIANGQTSQKRPATNLKISKSWQKLIEMISGNGMLASEIIEQLGVLPHSLRGQISNMRKAGILIESTRTKNGTIYKFAGIAEHQPQGAEQDDVFNGVNEITKDFYEQRAIELASRRMSNIA